ncbi:MAG: hypothetical protein R3D67_07315 [Hyphomicrobiaceae bacterium]
MALANEEPARLLSPAQATQARHLVEGMSIVIAPLMVGLLAAFALALPDQTREIYRLFARDYAFDLATPETANWPKVLQWAWQRLHFAPIDLSWIGATLAGVLNWIFARNLTLLFARDYIGTDTARGFALRWLPRLCGALIPLGAGVGLLLAVGEVHKLPFDVLASPSAPRQVDAAINLKYMAVFFFFIAFALVLFAYLRTAGRRRNKYTQANRWLFSTPAVLLMIAFSLGLIVLFSAPLSHGMNVVAAWSLGTPALFCLFIIVFSYFATGLSIVAQRYGVPIVPLIAVYAALLSLADCNDNHAVKVAKSDVAGARPGVREAFLDWYRARGDREFYERQGKPYPVFLVTAAGGGLYAADFAATGLARLQDGCPAFAQHTFAISGVSGGSFGGAIFTTLLAGNPQVRNEDIAGGDPCGRRASAAGEVSLEARARVLVSQDYLAPVVAAGLFTDFPQRLLPFPIAALDRSQAFDATLDQVWKHNRPECRGPGCSPFSKPFLETWRPTDTAPALVFNTTNVDVGYRTVLAPFVVAGNVPGEYSALQDFYNALSGGSGGGADGSGGDVTLATAIGLSSRFPWLMPAATVRLPDGRPKLRLLDGGIFENSGVDTLSDMLIDLAEFERPCGPNTGAAGGALGRIPSAGDQRLSAQPGLAGFRAQGRTAVAGVGDVVGQGAARGDGVLPTVSAARLSLRQAEPIREVSVRRIAVPGAQSRGLPVATRLAIVDIHARRGDASCRTSGSVRSDSKHPRYVRGAVIVSAAAIHSA